MTHHQVIISGGGLAGSVLAVALAQKGIASVIIEKAKPEPFLEDIYDGRNSALSLASAGMLKKLELWDDIHEKAQPIWDIIVSDGTVKTGASSHFLHFDHQDIGNQPLGYFVYNQTLRKALHKKIHSYHGIIDYRSEISIAKADLQPEKAHLTLSDGSALTADLLCICEGKESALRDLLGFHVNRWSYGQKAIVTTVEHEKPHQGVAQEFFMPSGPFAILPLVGNFCSLVWTESTEKADNLLSCSPELFNHELHLRFGDYLGNIKQVGKVWNYPLNFHLCPHPVADRVIVLADSAHAVHPISGQGFNLGLRDIASLIDVICQAQYCGLDIGNPMMIENYMKWRRFDTLSLSVITDSLNRIFSNDCRPVQFLRQVGLSAVQEMPFLKNLFMRHASGQIGDHPSLLKNCD